MFESLLVSKKTKTGKTKWFTFPVSLAIHSLVIACLLVASLWAVDNVREPPINVDIYRPVSLPPPAGPKKVEAKRQGPAKEQPKANPINIDKTAPTIVPPEPPKDENAPLTESDSGEGDQTRVIGGTGDPSDAGSPGWAKDIQGPPQEDIIVRPHAGVTSPVPIKKVEPRYPEVAKAAGVQGTVILEAIINKEGTVESVTLLRSIPLLDEAAIQAVKEWRFQPAMIGGNPVRCYFTLTVTFHLTRK
jgi:protein TonB